ncbi:MAG: six-hairpin glycosidase-like protein [Saprospirales bacterium]|nr:six-hairpin glycosidase-like protein [Saprospirales bacterium]
MRHLLILLLLSLVQFSFAQDWTIIDSHTISKKNPLSYRDNIEITGRKVAGIIYYDIDSTGVLSVERELLFPQLRRYTDDTANRWAVYRAYLKETLEDAILPSIYVDDRKLVPGKVAEIVINGTLVFKHAPSKSGISIERIFYPSSTQRLFVEQWTIANATDSTKVIQIGNVSNEKEDYGVSGVYTRKVTSDADQLVRLQPNERYTFRIHYSAHRSGEEELVVQDELALRNAFLDEVQSKLVLKTPEPVLNTLFAFSKIRAAENIFDSSMGLVHSPGGGRYYVGVWANDQGEYSGPFFPYLGYREGNIAALNAYKKFYAQMQEIPNHNKNLWSSFEMDGQIPCCGGDRGDAAMLAFGGLHYLLALGDRAIGEEYFPMVEWCLTYNHKKLNAEGVVLSDTDEMEGRIETGSANLSTSSLYYGALDLAIPYYTALGRPDAEIKELKARKQALGQAIETYFGAHVEGLDTYKYFKEHQHLRHWICLPLVVGIPNRKDATIEALFDRLWTENGVNVEKNSDNPEISKIFWDRGTLYALRGTFIAGETERSLEKLLVFSKKRLLGDRVPYVVEAYPEGDMAHLSAESALYCRVITEGLFGINPTGFNQFRLTPRLPKGWNEMALEKVQAFGASFDIQVSREGGKLEVLILAEEGKPLFRQVISEGESVVVTF